MCIHTPWSAWQLLTSEGPRSIRHDGAFPGRNRDDGGRFNLAWTALAVSEKREGLLMTTLMESPMAAWLSSSLSGRVKEVLEEKVLEVMVLKPGLTGEEHQNICLCVCVCRFTAFLYFILLLDRIERYTLYDLISGFLRASTVSMFLYEVVVLWVSWCSIIFVNIRSDDSGLVSPEQLFWSLVLWDG